MMQDSKRQKSSGLDFGVTPSNHLQPLVSSLGKALDGSDFGSRQLAGDYAASMLARTSEACLASGDAGTPTPPPPRPHYFPHYFPHAAPVPTLPHAPCSADDLSLHVDTHA